MRKEDRAKGQYPRKGPLKILERKRKDSYVVEMEDGSKRWLHANSLKPYVVGVNLVGVVFDDKEFGDVEEMPDIGAATSRERKNVSGVHECVQPFREVFSEKPGLSKVGRHKIRVVPGSRSAPRYQHGVPIKMRA